MVVFLKVFQFFLEEMVIQLQGFYGVAEQLDFVVQMHGLAAQGQSLELTLYLGLPADDLGYVPILLRVLCLGCCEQMLKTLSGSKRGGKKNTLN